MPKVVLLIVIYYYEHVLPCFPSPPFGPVHHWTLIVSCG